MHRAQSGSHYVVSRHKVARQIVKKSSHRVTPDGLKS
jgi:hypothetical protein